MALRLGNQIIHAVEVLEDAIRRRQQLIDDGEDPNGERVGYFTEVTRWGILAFRSFHAVPRTDETLAMAMVYFNQVVFTYNYAVERVDE